MFAGLTVCIALLGLLLVPIPLVRTLGVSAAIGVAVMMLAATTLLPCLLGFAGGRIDRFRLPFGAERPGVDPETTRRRDRYMFPLNTDYDLFSLGFDGRTAVSLGDTLGRDDVIRANNGGFFGIAAEY